MKEPSGGGDGGGVAAAEGAFGGWMLGGGGGDVNEGTVASVLQRSSKIHRSLGVRGRFVDVINAKLATVKRRKVLKQVSHQSPDLGNLHFLMKFPSRDVAEITLLLGNLCFLVKFPLNGVAEITWILGTGTVIFIFK